jgi:CBS domain-containing protein
MRAQELMTTNVLTCQEGESLERAAQLMWEGDVGAIPVVDADKRVIGMITDRDICMAAYTQGCGLAAPSVGSAMSWQPHTCKPGDGVALVEEAMRRHQVRRLPVVDEGRLVGMLSLNDLALAAGNRKASKTGQVTLEGVATTLARICDHRAPTAIVAE